MIQVTVAEVEFLYAVHVTAREQVIVIPSARLNTLLVGCDGEEVHAPFDHRAIQLHLVLVPGARIVAGSEGAVVTQRVHWHQIHAQRVKAVSAHHRIEADGSQREVVRTARTTSPPARSLTRARF